MPLLLLHYLMEQQLSPEKIVPVELIYDSLGEKTRVASIFFKNKLVLQVLGPVEESNQRLIEIKNMISNLLRVMPYQVE